ncbi:hypothetical protein HFE03_07670 [Paenibacillus sp. EKM102P]|uniref:hypothetical protein n=1 Tax=unclassified Paenibacillus TaxID=185978 RepID=UPI00142E6E88|nr:MULTISPECIES: hypothetical protein [unclassified Paenibacillus]KAF6620521.1 hypothetical protein HFE00_05575 [Paenibacillus sp. EKM101P]KAF6623513.1 hypothetical protein HFE03_07670 [Paenibacillus sp. EKM102P]KAF6633923.1 hypothetical protein HFE01_06835 [Paenibacillus sp. EKM10P]KAF6649451.1 hypothetical protein HFE02_01800 [Paenibacillus sp. EKM11P]
MKINQQFQCEKCEEVFTDEGNCANHEANCCPEETRWCYKCGKTETWNEKDDWAFSYQEQWHTINLGRVGYGSSLDACDVEFTICDDCLYGFIDTFTIEGQEKIHNSGSNGDLPTDIWIREARGELSDEEYEDYGMYSPRQIKAYKERFPICEKVIIYEYEDGSRGSHCCNFTFGDREGKADRNGHSKCFDCVSFKERTGEIEIEKA